MVMDKPLFNASDCCFEERGIEQIAFRLSLWNNQGDVGSPFAGFSSSF